MYTNPSNIIDTLINLLEINSLQLNTLVQVYEPKKSLTVFKGLRTTLPNSSYPCLEIETNNAANQWYTTRAQRPRYNFQITLTTSTQKEKFHLEYISTIGTAIVSLLTSPNNLQLTVVNETRWSPNGGLGPTVITDSLVEDVAWNTFKGGTIRTAEMSWFALIHEPYPDFKFAYGSSNQPTVLRPRVIS